MYYKVFTPKELNAPKNACMYVVPKPMKQAVNMIMIIIFLYGTNKKSVRGSF